MKLCYMAQSPCARKALVCAAEMGIADQLTVVEVETSPIHPSPWPTEWNPHANVPVLVCDDGLTLYDADVICSYLADLSGDRTVLPRARGARWRALGLNALAAGIADAAIAIRQEETRPMMLYWRDWVLAQSAKMVRAFDVLERDDAFFDEPLSIGQIAVATSLEWCDYRQITPDFREGRSRLAAWFAAFRARPSMRRLPPERLSGARPVLAEPA